MRAFQLLASTFTLAPLLVSAAIFPSDTRVKMLDEKGFKKIMKLNQTSMVAFVAPWCGHCQRMAPEYSRAALGLHPLLPVYAVDCDAEANKRLCAEQGVKGFPTVKLFPRGNQLGSMTYESGERTANAIFNWASRRVPNTVAKLSKLDEISAWASKNVDKPRALLLTKDKKIPLLWKVLGNKYNGQIELGIHRDKKGKTLKAMGYESKGEKQGKILVYPGGSTNPVRYEGLNKLEPLSKFFNSVLDGTADLKIAKEAEKAESSKSTPDSSVDEGKEPEETMGQDHQTEDAEQVVFEAKTASIVVSSMPTGECTAPENIPGAAPAGECTPPTADEDVARPTDEL